MTKAQIKAVELIREDGGFRLDFFTGRFYTLKSRKNIREDVALKILHLFDVYYKPNSCDDYYRFKSI